MWHKQRQCNFFVEEKMPLHFQYSHYLQWLQLLKCHNRKSACYRTPKCRSNYLGRVSYVPALLHRCSRLHDLRSYQKSQVVSRKSRTILWQRLANILVVVEGSGPQIVRVCVKTSLLYRQFRTLRLTKNMKLTALQNDPKANADALSCSDFL